ncbi:STY0301 family protein [Massilia genomosp. 1]|uniref:DUF3757 domain-containing protein n=1 Tax=Massilia genomosp. 1 TaxID=2609280 RepID=A0ABX0MFV2_9BURK|nr:STY0301 family protein [Massilia genomosp. 1]NHZ61196.1 hypothetical protein [Massilia genomosp. 1]
MKLIFSFCLLLAAMNAGAQGIKPCPEEFPVEAIKLSSLPEGWIGVTPSKLPLVSADATTGRPQPAADIGQQRKMRHGYEMIFNTKSTAPSEKWLSCRYGVGGDLTLAQRLPDNIERCTVSYYKRPAYNDYDISVACYAAPSKPPR